jgi:hypothetical protein
MSPHQFWRRLVAAVRRERARRIQRAIARGDAKPQLAQELLETLSPEVLMGAGRLRRRVVYRRRVAYARLRHPR